MWKVTLLFSRSTLSSKLLKTSYDSLVLKMHAQGKVQGERWSRGVEGRPGRLPSGSTGRGQAEDEKAQTKARTTGPRQIQFFQGPQSPTCRQLVSSEMTTQESVASWGGILTISVTRRRQQRRGSPTAQEAGSEVVPPEGGIWEGRLPFPTCPAACVTGRTTTPDLAGG